MTKATAPQQNEGRYRLSQVQAGRSTPESSLPKVGADANAPQGTAHCPEAEMPRAAEAGQEGRANDDANPEARCGFEENGDAEHERQEPMGWIRNGTGGGGRKHFQGAAKPHDVVEQHATQKHISYDQCGEGAPQDGIADRERHKAKGIDQESDHGGGKKPDKASPHCRLLQEQQRSRRQQDRKGG